MHSPAVVFKAAPPPRAVLVCASLNLTGIFLPKRMELSLLQVLQEKKTSGTLFMTINYFDWGLHMHFLIVYASEVFTSTKQSGIPKTLVSIFCV